MPSTNKENLKENAAVRKRLGRKNRGRRSRKQPPSTEWDEDSMRGPLLASSHGSLTSEKFCQTAQVVETRCFATPVKRRQIADGEWQTDVSSPEADRVPLHPLGAASNRSRPSFLSPLCSPRKPRNARFARPVRAMMDVFLDSRARSDMEDESDDESFRAIERRLGISKYVRTPESPTPSSSRASSRDTNSPLSTPTRASRQPPLEKFPLRGLGLYLWRTQGCPSESTTSICTKRYSTLASQRQGFWKREAERLRSRAPKIFLPSWHLGLTPQGDGEDTERLMTLAEVSLTEMELDVSDLDLDPPEHQRFEVLGDRSTANWS